MEYKICKKLNETQNAVDVCDSIERQQTQIQFLYTSKKYKRFNSITIRGKNQLFNYLFYIENKNCTS